MFRIRIPIDADLQPWLIGLFVVMVLMVGIVITARLWKVWGLAAWAVLVLADLPANVAHVVTLAGAGLPPGLVWRGPALSLVGSGLLVWAALLFWGLRRKVDSTGAVFAALVYGALMPPSMRLVEHLQAAASAAVLLLCVASACRWIAKLPKAAFAGLAFGTVAARLAWALTGALAGGAPFSLRWLGWSVAEGLIAGGLAAGAIRWLKAEPRGARRVLATVQGV